MRIVTVRAVLGVRQLRVTTEAFRKRFLMALETQIACALGQHQIPVARAMRMVAGGALTCIHRTMDLQSVRFSIFRRLVVVTSDAQLFDR